MSGFGWNYPPGVTGNEPQITGEWPCEECDGCGYDEDEDGKHPCPHCNGTGVEPENFDEEQEDYANLADEMNDPDVGPWNEADWDERAVENAKRYAERNGLSWPPQTGDFDRWYDQQHNPS